MGIMGKKRKKMGISKTPSKYRGKICWVTCPSHTLKKIKPSFHEHWEHDFKNEKGSWTFVMITQPNLV